VVDHDRNRVTVHESIKRDNFKREGGLPLAVLSIPNFDLSWRFNRVLRFRTRARFADGCAALFQDFAHMAVPVWPVISMDE
jgi:hypothetical protein